jgi:hypothetical protein
MEGLRRAGLPDVELGARQAGLSRTCTDERGDEDIERATCEQKELRGEELVQDFLV